ncbi:Sphingosine N-acyltransferase lag1 [Coemansia biformis]|uniref:Sphingosine N-acyltransferase lag1 n=1 Tax=Coemansia biformis TaxID=1286918 RepID=A0A9W7YEV1_9FUNG|nr:Sphingosine N-acyltransferase lag1 [Coemansia biformis]
MPPLEKRLPRAMAIVEATQRGPQHRIVSDPAVEIDDPMEGYPSKASRPTRRLRQRLRRIGKPSAEPVEDLGASTAGGHPAASGDRTVVRKRNMVLSTRNPAVVWLATNELAVSLVVLAVVHGCQWAGYAWPSAWLSLQHQALDADSPRGVRYVRGIHDITFVVCWIFRIVAARAIILHHVLPTIPRLLGVTSRRNQRRFCEMGWFLGYILTSMTIGVRLWRASPYYMNTSNLYANYPEDHMLMPYGLKYYYLVQTAFWTSNIYTIFVEERRKDHLEMLAHHMVTIALVVSSYCFHFTRFGHVFMLVMDLPDIFLSMAKMFRYVGCEMIPNILFGAFTASWVTTKHYLCIKLMVSIWTKGVVLVPPEKRFPHHPNSYASYTIVGVLWAVLCVLQAILIYWFFLILKVLERVLIKGEDAEDSRSDNEGDSDDDEGMPIPDAKQSAGID